MNDVKRKNEERKQLRKEWSQRPIIERIEFVIHDGQWYTKEKWAKVALVKEKDKDVLDKWIEKHDNILIKKDNSYRVDYNEVVKWYKENNHSLPDVYVPNNFPPKLWAGKTEAEHFIACPKHTLTALQVKSENLELINKIHDLVKDYGRTGVDHHGKFYCHTLQAAYLKEKLLKNLTKKELADCSIKVRQYMTRRELADLDDEFLEEHFKFYYSYAYHLLKSHFKTIDIFLSSHEDKKGQIYEWLVTAIQKFDSSKPIPFSGYLANVLMSWPYDLPDYALGKELALYQRKRSKAINKYEKEHKTPPTIDELKQLMLLDYSEEEFAKFEDQHHKWISISNASDLMWEGKNSEKTNVSAFSRENNDNNYKRKSELTRAFIKAGLESSKYDECFLLLSQLSVYEQNLDVFKSLSDDYKTSLAKCLREDE